MHTPLYVVAESSAFVCHLLDSYSVFIPLGEDELVIQPPDELA